MNKRSSISSSSSSSGGGDGNDGDRFPQTSDSEREHAPSHRSRRSARGILKKQPGRSKRARIVWSEENLAQNEAERVVRIKIDEPKTPFVAYVLDDLEPDVDGYTLHSPRSPSEPSDESSASRSLHFGAAGSSDSLQLPPINLFPSSSPSSASSASLSIPLNPPKLHPHPASPASTPMDESTLASVAAALHAYKGKSGRRPRAAFKSVSDEDKGATSSGSESGYHSSSSTSSSKKIFAQQRKAHYNEFQMVKELLKKHDDEDEDDDDDAQEEDKELKEKQKSEHKEPIIPHHHDKMVSSGSSLSVRSFDEADDEGDGSALPKRPIMPISASSVNSQRNSALSPANLASHNQRHFNSQQPQRHAHIRFAEQQPNDDMMSDSSSNRKQGSSSIEQSPIMKSEDEEDEIVSPLPLSQQLSQESDPSAASASASASPHVLHSCTSSNSLHSVASSSSSRSGGLTRPRSASKQLRVSFSQEEASWAANVANAAEGNDDHMSHDSFAMRDGLLDDDPNSDSASTTTTDMDDLFDEDEENEQDAQEEGNSKGEEEEDGQEVKGKAESGGNSSQRSPRQHSSPHSASKHVSFIAEQMPNLNVNQGPAGHSSL